MALRLLRSGRAGKGLGRLVQDGISHVALICGGPARFGPVMGRTEQAPRAMAPHPLDPLSETEVTLASDTLRREKGLGDDIRFTHVQLEEPAKPEVLAWEPGEGLARRAAATLFDCKTGV